ncbi:flagellar motor switch protein FliN/FliY [Methylobacterium sp. UNC378MF]|uniref:flagellar motor switch protein FliN n=1 Tax=Methylobacterium sp. UNC378MF TaxID=1502748 RepID=UPI0008907456|nr:flagellar motor switch protein FliN [Methylobacterium sp. UNC378MF]SDA11364.1 flagellar motor switch protein FliN/FliY [Methylobacterium sp. UNC378MF]
MSPPSDQPTVDSGAGTGHSESLFARIEAQAESPRSPGEPLGSGRNLDSILRIPVLMQVVLGSATMPVSSLMKLGRGAIVPLDHRVGEPVDVVVNGRVIARGEVVVVEDDNSRFGVSLTEIVGPAAADANG